MNRHCSHRSPGTLAVLSLLLVLAGLACVKRPVDYEREYARTLAPKRLETSAPAAGPGRKLRVRVYADADYRRQVLSWERGIEAQLRRASDVVRGPLSVEFELDSLRAWERHGGQQDLESSVTQLEALDAGEDVDLVIGLVSALPVFSATHHELGRARMLGRHCVLRGMENPEEHRWLMARLTHLPDAEREALYRERKLHKETSVLLHEWAHTLGAFHVQDSSWMMAPSYETSQAAFSPQTLRLLATSLRHLPQGRRSTEAQQAWARELQELLSTTVWPQWEGPDKQWVLGWTERALSGEAPLGPQTAPPLSPVDRQKLDEVAALERQGRYEMAAQLLEPLAQRLPRDERVQVTACYLATRVAPKLPATRERCEATATRFPHQPSPLMNLAIAQLQAERPADAQVSLLKARERLETQPSVDADLWADLAGLFQSASCVTWAEQTAARAAGTERASKVLAWTTRTRRWKALPVDAARSGVAVEREGDFIRAAMEVEALLERGAMEKARARVAGLSREFPRAALPHVLQCEMNLRTGRQGPARTACRQAVATHEEAVQAHLLLGLMAAGVNAEGRSHLERAIALEPELPEAWRMLAQQYRAAGLGKELRNLQERYRARFARELN